MGINRELCERDPSSTAGAAILVQPPGGKSPELVAFKPGGAFVEGGDKIVRALKTGSGMAAKDGVIKQTGLTLGVTVRIPNGIIIPE